MRMDATSNLNLSRFRLGNEDGCLLERAAQVGRREKLHTTLLRTHAHTHTHTHIPRARKRTHSHTHQRSLNGICVVQGSKTTPSVEAEGDESETSRP